MALLNNVAQTHKTLELHQEVREVDHPTDTEGERQKKRRRTMLAP